MIFCISLSVQSGSSSWPKKWHLADERFATFGCWTDPFQGETVENKPLPPHPGLEGVDLDNLKHKCPAFATGCPYAKIEEADSLAVSFGELSKCPAFKAGCPFTNKSKEEITALLASVPKEHPSLNMNEIPTCEEGIQLVGFLNQFLTASQLDHVFLENDSEPAVPSPVLEDPQLASAMREGTKVIHRAAESSVFTRRFLKGDISREEYGRYILSLYFVYQKMEELLRKHKDHPVVKLIHFPEELDREDTLVSDLQYFYGKDLAAAVMTDPASKTPAVQRYLDAMDKACDVNPALLIAHSYSRYLGDLSGGQILAKRLKKCILQLQEGDASWDTKEGLAFYHFEALGNQAEFKDYYRHQLNGAKVDAETRDLIVQEAVVSFELNIGLFDEIQSLSEANQLIPMKRRRQPRHTPQADNGFGLTCYIMATTLAISAATIGYHAYKRFYKSSN
ncbi:heme oxygenase-domain-containing protein [Gongronella butleri]|nr:heme oxygenase-domain-containing protein [Gongronella butleri]